jgi:hypothetical protein
MFCEQHWSTALIKIFPTPENNMVWTIHVSWKQLVQYELILTLTNVIHWIDTYSTDWQHSILEEYVKSEETRHLSLYRNTWRKYGLHFQGRSSQFFIGIETVHLQSLISIYQNTSIHNWEDHSKIIVLNPDVSDSINEIWVLCRSFRSFAQN